MFFTLPVKAYIEKECVKNHCDIFASIGKKALIVTGKSSSRKNGSLSDVVDVLNEAHIDYIIFDEVEENPSVETVMRARDKGICENVDFVIGVGGGSPLDASKAIASMIYHADKGEEYLYDKNADNKALPVICIPTTCGTGSCVTSASVITVHKQRTKKSIVPRIFPQYAFVDGKYIKSAPIDIIRATAIDALGHLYESYINAKATRLSRMVASEGMRIWSEAKKALTGEAELDYDMCEKLMSASMVAGLAISLTGTSIPHGLSYAVTYETGLAHGKAIGYFLAGYLKQSNPKESEYVLKTSGFSSVDEFESFFKKVSGVSRLDEKVLEQAIDELIQNKSKLACCPYKVDRDLLSKIAYDFK